MNIYYAAIQNFLDQTVVLNYLNTHHYLGAPSGALKDMFQVYNLLERQMRQYIKFGGMQAVICVPLIAS